MTSLVKTFCFLLILVSSLSSNAQRKAVFIIVDGIPEDVIQKLKPPVLMEIAKKGGITKAYVGGDKDGYSQSPTISAVGYNHILTGVWTNKHNVWDNDIKDPNYNYWNVFRIVKEVNPSLKTAIFSTWQDNRTKLAGDGLASAGSVTIDYGFDGFELDTIKYPHTQDRKFIYDIDEKVSREAARYIGKNAPDLSWVYLEFTDDMGHAFGDSPQFYDAIQKADQQIGRIWSVVKEREKTHKEEWLVIITTDHGRDASTGKNHGGQSDRERRTWIVTNSAECNKHFNQLPGAVDIAPTLLRHLRINTPDPVRSEMDGIPFVGKLSIANLRASREANRITVTWDNNNAPNGEAEILLARTNNFKTGKVDEYTSMGKVKVSAGKFTIDTTKYPSSFYKILVKGPENWANVWITE